MGILDPVGVDHDAVDQVTVNLLEGGDFSADGRPVGYADRDILTSFMLLETSGGLRVAWPVGPDGDIPLGSRSVIILVWRRMSVDSIVELASFREHVLGVGVWEDPPASVILGVCDYHLDSGHPPFLSGQATCSVEGMLLVFTVALGSELTLAARLVFVAQLPPLVGRHLLQSFAEVGQAARRLESRGQRHLGVDLLLVDTLIHVESIAVLAFKPRTILSESFAVGGVHAELIVGLVVTSDAITQLLFGFLDVGIGAVGEEGDVPGRLERTPPGRMNPVSGITLVNVS